MSVNKVILIGRMGADPEVRYFQDGNAICNFSLATSEKWKDKQTGERKERTEWHRVSILGKLAEIAGQYLRKGSNVYIEGKLQTREWEKDGIKRYSTEIVVDMKGVMQMLDGKQDGQQGEYQQQQARQQTRQQAQQQAQQQPDEFTDDIPW